MKNKLLLVLLMLVQLSPVFVTPSYGSQPAAGPQSSEEENPTVTLTPEVKDFIGLECNLPARITYTQGKEYKVVIELPKNIAQYIVTKVNDKGVLKIGVDYDEKKSLKIFKNIRISVSSPMLENVEINGAGVFDVPQMTELKSLQIELNGAAKVSLAELKCKDFDLEINGAGKAVGNIVSSDQIKISGNGAGKAEFKANSKSVIVKGSGACSYDFDVKSEKVKVSLAGTCKVVLKVDTDDLSVSASGVNKVVVSGEAKHHSLSASGLSKINTESLQTK